MEERRRGCFVATEAPSPFLGLVAIAVLPPSGLLCCRRGARRDVSPPSCFVAKLLRCRSSLLHRRRSSLLHRRRSSPTSYPLSPGKILCSFESGYGFDSDDELQRLIKIEKLPPSCRRFIRVTIPEETWQIVLWWWRNYGGRHWILLLLKGVQFHSLMWRNKNLLCQGGQGQEQEQLRLVFVFECWMICFVMDNLNFIEKVVSSGSRAVHCCDSTLFLKQNHILRGITFSREVKMLWDLNWVKDGYMYNMLCLLYLHMAANLCERFEQRRHVLSWPKTLVNKWFNIKCKTNNFQADE
ncbi:hypothetical protein Ahy_B04g071812 [Arachis hypogaea]|uniref:Uncharacterized protein n=1 Tax=Arachis hypogaea TaxID=3818 RepID=A0A444ZLN7_ARAHY|nr:hypothetical protein Ahy_B04g071812 [Arachis hypogaea]